MPHRMKDANRRNYYRVLQVQPEAPMEVIRASYRTLMGTLHHHPDLGGDHDDAVLLNEAFHVLSDPARRAAYDLAQRAQIEAARGTAGMLNLRGCPLCGEALPATVAPPATARSRRRQNFPAITANCSAAAAACGATGMRPPWRMSVGPRSRCRYAGTTSR